MKRKCILVIKDFSDNIIFQKRVFVQKASNTRIKRILG